MIIPFSFYFRFKSTLLRPYKFCRRWKINITHYQCFCSRDILEFSYTLYCSCILQNNHKMNLPNETLTKILSNLNLSELWRIYKEDDSRISECIESILCTAKELDFSNMSSIIDLKNANSHDFSFDVLCIYENSKENLVSKVTLDALGRERQDFNFTMLHNLQTFSANSVVLFEIKLNFANLTELNLSYIWSHMDIQTFVPKCINLRVLRMLYCGQHFNGYVRLNSFNNLKLKSFTWHSSYIQDGNMEYLRNFLQSQRTTLESLSLYSSRYFLNGILSSIHLPKLSKLELSSLDGIPSKWLSNIDNISIYRNWKII